MSEAVVLRPAAEPTCEVCGSPGMARVCAYDGVDLVCHGATCDEVCVKCRTRAASRELAEAEGRPPRRDAVEPCILQVQAGCKTRAEDEAAALQIYRTLGLDKHSRKSFAADVLIGSFENVRLTGEVALGNDKLDNFRHLTHCWTCWPPHPRCAEQWCVHPREVWSLREATPGAIDLAEIARQIRAIEKVKRAVLDAVPKAASEIVGRRLRNLIEIAAAAEEGERHG